MEEKTTILEDDMFNDLSAERTLRLQKVMIFVPALLGAVLALVPYALNLSIFESQSLAIFSITLFLMSGIMIIMMYLNTGFKKQNSLDFKYGEYQNKLPKDSEFNVSELEQLKKDIKALQLISEQNSSINKAIETKDSDKLIELLKNKFIEKSSDKILNKIEEKVKTVNEINDIENIFSQTLERLNEEKNALARRGNINLILGIITTIAGLSILGYFVIVVDKIPVDKIAFIAYFIPRLSLVILIEVFAYFFLKLYKSSLSEIKYFQNEMTNIESKFIALKCSFMVSDDETTSNVISILANIERNAILEKGQTTADIEKSKIEQQNIATISEKVSSMIGKNKNA